MGFGGLYTAVTGLTVTRQSLDTVSHNIANSNNPGYVRQSAIHATNRYTSAAGDKLQVGTGVNLSEIRQIKDEFLDKKIRGEMASFGYHYAKANILEDVEGVFNEITNSGLQNVMNGFWNNWNELYKEPESLTIRGLVHESAVAFTETVSHLATQLNDIKQNLNKEIEIKVVDINNTLEQIADLNKKIKLVEGENSKIKANDFRDQRNVLLDKLSRLVPVTTYENRFSESVVTLDGRDLVNSTFISKIHMEKDSDGLGHIYFQNSTEKIDLKGGGDLGGYIDVRDKSMGQYMNRLDILVGNMANAINDIHSTGYDLNGDKLGTKFFTGDKDGNITAANIKVNSLLANFNMIAASGSGAKGDGEIAKAINEARKNDLFGKYKADDPFGATDKTMTTDEYYRDITLSLSIERSDSKGVAENQHFLINSIDERRREISGVSLDEEMTEMIKFQHAYSANSRVINAIDEMIDHIVNRM